jgi:hypothetical protein
MRGDAILSEVRREFVLDKRTGFRVKASYTNKNVNHRMTLKILPARRIRFLPSKKVARTPCISENALNFRAEGHEKYASVTQDAGNLRGNLFSGQLAGIIRSRWPWRYRRRGTRWGRTF